MCVCAFEYLYMLIYINEHKYTYKGRFKNCKLGYVKVIAESLLIRHYKE